ncbi:Mdm33 family-domain-containing protein [Xylaria intraflava]|nr:Mdm33 family-domain-containing protein [Xylaria intraflava]
MSNLPPATQFAIQEGSRLQVSMSTPRAVRSLFGFGSSLIVDQLFPTSATRTAKALFPPAPASSTRPPIPICWNCRYDYAARLQQKRFSSSSPKPPNDAGRGESPFDPLMPSSSCSSSSPSSASASSFSSSSSSHSTATEASSIGSQEPGKEGRQRDEKEQSQSSPSTASHPDLPSALNSQRSALNQSLSAFMDRAQTTLFTASQRINDLTGYSSIESLKTQISTLESGLRTAQTTLTDARSAYKNAVSDRSSTQREVTTLLARQKTWTPIDFERFTTLYRQDYELEASVGERAAELEHAEQEAERLGRELGASILARYHEEQIWSDKIRRMSTWGTWGLMGVNILLFLLLQFGAEPWRRHRLVRGFEEKVREAIAEERLAREEAERVAVANAAAIASAAEKEAATTSAEEEPPVLAVPDLALSETDVVPPASESPEPSPESEPPRISWRAALTDTNYWRLTLWDLLSDRKIALRMRDISLIAVEGVAIGATVAGSLALLLLRRT